MNNNNSKSKPPTLTNSNNTTQKNTTTSTNSKPTPLTNSNNNSNNYKQKKTTNFFNTSWCKGHNLRKGVAICIFLLMLSNIILTLVYPGNPTLGFWFQVMRLVSQVVLLILFVIFGWWMCYPLTFYVLIFVTFLINYFLIMIYLGYVGHDLRQAVSGPDDAHDRPKSGVA